jgi:hypothetical protein
VRARPNVGRARSGSSGPARHLADGLPDASDQPRLLRKHLAQLRPATPRSLVGSRLTWASSCCPPASSVSVRA